MFSLLVPEKKKLKISHSGERGCMYIGVGRKRLGGYLYRLLVFGGGGLLVHGGVYVDGLCRQQHNKMGSQEVAKW